MDPTDEVPVPLPVAGEGSRRAAGDHQLDPPGEDHVTGRRPRTDLTALAHADVPRPSWLGRGTRLAARLPGYPATMAWPVAENPEPAPTAEIVTGPFRSDAGTVTANDTVPDALAMTLPAAVEPTVKATFSPAGSPCR